MESIGWGWIIQVLLSVLLVGALFFGFSQFLRRFSATAGVVTGQGELFRVVSKQVFDTRNSIYLVEVGRKQYLLFGNSEKIQLLDSGEPELFHNEAQKKKQE